MKRMWSGPPSIRRQLWCTLLLTLLFALLFNSGFSSFIVRHEVDEVFDAQLVTSTRMLKTLILKLHDAGGSHLDAGLDNLFADLDEVSDNIQHYEQKMLLQLWSRDGNRMLFRSPQSPDHALAPLQPGMFRMDYQHGRWDVFVAEIPEMDAWLMVAEIPDARDEINETLFGIMLVSGGLALVLATVMLASAINAGLQPLEQLSERLRQRTLDNLQPVELQPEPPELQPVIHSLNHLFERLTDGIERERRFVADAAHELRTPLAVMQLEAQQLQRLATEQGAGHLLDGLMAGIQRGGHIVEQLLLLARLERGAAGIAVENLQPQTVDLAEAVRRVLVEHYSRVLDGGGELEIDLDQFSAPVNLNPVLLGIAIRNLLCNGMLYGGGQLQVQLRDGGFRRMGMMGVEVRDHGPGVDAESLARLTEPFFRNGRQDGSGAGLGLSIIQKIMEAFGGQLELSSQPGQGLSATLWFPKASTVNGGE